MHYYIGPIAMFPHRVAYGLIKNHFMIDESYSL